MEDSQGDPAFREALGSFEGSGSVSRPCKVTSDGTAAVDVTVTPPRPRCAPFLTHIGGEEKDF